MGSFFNGKKILITGGGGYIAYSIIELLKKVPCQLIVLDRSPKEKEAAIINNTDRAHIQMAKGDVRNPETWLPLIEGIDIIFHLASQTSIYEAKNNPISDLGANVIPMLQLLELCKERKLSPTIIYSGTATEVGIPETLPVNELHIDRPTTIYDLHKLMAEKYLKHYVKEGVVKGAILRLANVYGPGPKNSRKDRGILNQMVSRAMRGENLTVYGDGNFVRDYIYIEDVAKSFLAAAESIEKVNGDHFIIGSGKGTTIQDAFTLVASRVALTQKINVKILNIDPPIDLPAIEKRNFVADISKISSLTGWTAKIGIQDGIDFTIDWYLTMEG